MNVLSKRYCLLISRMPVSPGRQGRHGRERGCAVVKAQRTRQENQGPYAEDQRGHLIHPLNINPSHRQDRS